MAHQARANTIGESRLLETIAVGLAGVVALVAMIPRDAPQSLCVAPISRDAQPQPAAGQKQPVVELKIIDPVIANPIITDPVLKDMLLHD